MKIVNVSAAIIIKNNHVFITERSYGEFKDMWEFPGGKIENEESPENAVIREIKEELNTEIRVERFIGKVEHDYDTFHLSMNCFLCSIVSGKLELLEHEDSSWVRIEKLDSVDFLPADRKILPKIKELLVENKK